MASRSMPVSLAALLPLVLLACGESQVRDTPPPPPPKKAEAPPEPDAFRDHSGAVVAMGETFRVQNRAVGVKGANIVVYLLKATWTKRTLPDGREVRDGAAEIEVHKGEERSRRILEQGESSVVFGVRITVKGAGEDYDKKRYDYLPWVELVVEAASESP